MIERVAGFDARPPENRAALRPFLVASAEETYPEPLGAEAAASMIAQLAASEDLYGFLTEEARILVVRREGEIVASCCHGPLKEGVVWFWGFYVRRAAQRQGLGRRLLQEILRAHPQARLLMATVLRASAPAIRFYRALGFSLEERRVLTLAPGRVESTSFVIWSRADRRPRARALLSFEPQA